MIRLADAKDAARLAELHATAFTAPWTAAALADLASDPHVVVWLADQGFILVRAVAGEAEILTLAVAPAARRQGLGRALVEAGVAAAKAAGAKTLFLEVAADNLAAIALYNGAGFEPAGRRRGYYRHADGPAMDALVLRRILTASNA